MITDNSQHPKTYETTKLMDTFPLGATKVVLSQSHYNEHTDFCGEDKDLDNPFFGDDEMHYICDLFQSKLKPINPSNPEESVIATTWKLSKVNDKLYVHGQPQTIQAIPSDNTIVSTCEWHIFIDGEEYTNKLEELYSYLDITIDKENHTFTIAAINKDLAKYIIAIKIYDEDKTYYDFVEMEVSV